MTVALSLAYVLLVLWHGAGGDVTEALDGGGRRRQRQCDVALVVRARFPYRVAGQACARSHAAPPHVGARVRSTRRWRCRTPAGRRLVLGGRSMGGRHRLDCWSRTACTPTGLVFPELPAAPGGTPRQAARRAPAVGPVCDAVRAGRSRRPRCAIWRCCVPQVLKRASASAPSWRCSPGADHGMRKAPADEIARTVAESYLAATIAR